MTLPLPNLDDRRWQDLTSEAIPLIPRYAPSWTDFNIHDPGITLTEMFAWLTEAMVYQLNQVPDRFSWKFLSLIGHHRHGPAPARTILTFNPAPAGPPLRVPAGTQFSAPAVFSLTRALDVAQIEIAAVQTDDGTGTFRDVSADFAQALPIMPVGTNPAAGAALYLGFQAVPQTSPAALWFKFAGPSGLLDRARLVEEAAAHTASCQNIMPGWACGDTTPAAESCQCETDDPAPPHHSARLVWEFFSPGGDWVSLIPVAPPSRPAPGEIFDDTRSLTLDGLVEFNLPATAAPTAVGAIPANLIYVRARLAAGAYDAPVTLTSLWPNAGEAVQTAPLTQALAIAGTVQPPLPAPTPGDTIALSFTITPDLTIQSIALQTPPPTGAPAFLCLAYLPPAAGAPGTITLAAAVAGLGTGVPSQTLHVPNAPLLDCCFTLYLHDGKSWVLWRRVTDFEAATRTDLAFTLDPTTGLITCGDGEHGQVFPQAAAIVVTASSTLAASGNLPASTPWRIAQTPLNTLLLATMPGDARTLLGQIAQNPIAATGGASAETLPHAEGKAAAVVHAHERILDLAESAQQPTLDQIPKPQVLALPPPDQAVTIFDTERLALNVPGTQLARARAWPDTDPALPGIHASGVVTVVILPAMPIPAPTPSAGLIAAVSTYLNRRRVLCTRIAVAAPSYVTITITASITALTGAATATVKAAILSALEAFLNPLTGGPAALGWPFGRFVYNAEILRLIATTPGVDYVKSLTMTAGKGQPQCGDIALCPTFLVTSGPHQITVTSS
jgi:hypothetical protein